MKYTAQAPRPTTVWEARGRHFQLLPASWWFCHSPAICFTIGPSLSRWRSFVPVLRASTTWRSKIVSNFNRRLPRYLIIYPRRGIVISDVRERNHAAFWVRIIAHAFLGSNGAPDFTNKAGAPWVLRERRSWRVGFPLLVTCQEVRRLENKN